MKRISLGSLIHESNTFATDKTSLEAFRRQELLFDEDVIRRHAGERTELGGMIEVAQAAGLRILATASATAISSGPLSAEAYSFLENSLVERLEGLLPLDGVLLALHGATVAETADDVAGRLLRRVREVVGNGVPIGVTLDHHANVTRSMVEYTDLLIGYRTHPHVDQKEVGCQLAEAMLAMIEKRVKPVTVMTKLPMLLPGESAPAARDRLVEKVREIERQSGVLTASFFIGFPFADLEETGPCAVVTAREDRSLAAFWTRELAELMWSLRDDFALPTVSVERALHELPDVWNAPEVFVDMGDCSYAGAAGDVPFFLERLLRLGIRDAVIASVLDPEAVALCIEAGVGAWLTLEIGGKRDRVNGVPVRARGVVQFISDGKYRGRDFYLRPTEVDIGSAVVFNTEGIEVLLTTERAANYDPALLRSMGIEPGARRVIVLKGGMLNRVTYDGIAARIRPFNSPGFANWDFFRKTYERIRRPIYPLDEVPAAETF